MGKTKGESKRTKGNTKPSSSARSADLLNAQTGTTNDVQQNIHRGILPNSSLPVLGLGGLSGLGDELAEDALPNELKQSMKKMSKKDATTKIKALQEFTELINNGIKKEITTNTDDDTPDVPNTETDLEKIKSVLPFWPRLYCKLSNDNDRRVREYAHKAHLQISTKVGRDLAPYLRSISASWYLGRFDCHAPAASAANEAFKVVFPAPSSASSSDSSKKDKHREAIVFCASEILNAIKDNITNVALQNSGSDSKSTSEEMEARYNRVLACSLNAYAAFWDELATSPVNTRDKNMQIDNDNLHAYQIERWEQLNASIEKTKDIQNSILNEVKFWKFSQSKDYAIRSAWYTLLCSFCKHCFIPVKGKHEEATCDEDTGSVLVLSKKHLEKIASATLGHLDDTTDSVVSSKIWEATLHLISKFKAWTSLIDIEKRVIPKIFSALERPSHSTVLYPSLIPLLSKLPQANCLEDSSEDVKWKVSNFYSKFFTSFRKGAEKELGFLRQNTKKEISHSSTNTSYGRYGIHANSILKSCVNAYFECVIYGIQHVCSNADVTCETVSQDIQNERPGMTDIFCTQVCQWIDELVLTQIEVKPYHETPAEKEEPSDVTASLADEETNRPTHYGKNQYFHMLSHESILIQGYGRFLNALDRHQTKLINLNYSTPNITAEIRKLFWDHLMGICSKLHNLSASDPRALKYLQVLLSSLYEFPKTNNREIPYKNIENSQKKLRFTDNSAVKSEGSIQNNLPTTRKEVLINSELQKIVRDLAVESLLLVLKASSKTSKANLNHPIYDKERASSYYSEQLKFINGLLKQQNTTISSDSSNGAKFYEELWQGITISIANSNDAKVYDKTTNTTPDLICSNSFTNENENRAIYGVLNIICNDVMFENEYLKDKEIQSLYVELYYILMDALPLKERASYLSNQFFKIYKYESTSVASTKTYISRFEWMLLVLKQLVSSSSGNQGISCLKEMVVSYEEGVESFSSLVTEMTNTMFTTKSESNTELLATNGDTRMNILQLLITYVGSVIPNCYVNKILTSLHTACENANQYFQCMTEESCNYDECNLLSQTTGAVTLLKQFLKHRPNVWYAYSCQKQRLKLLLTLFKLSTYSTLNDEILYTLGKCWMEGLQVLGEDIHTKSTVDQEKEIKFTEMLVSFVKQRISYLHQVLIENPHKDSNINEAIDTLADQAWKYLIEFYKRFDTNVDAVYGRCWRGTLCDMLLLENEYNLDKDKEEEVMGLLLAERVGITSFPFISSKNLPNTVGMGEPNHHMYDTMNTTSCRFFVRICHKALTGHMYSDSSTYGIAGDVTLPYSVTHGAKLERTTLLETKLFTLANANETCCKKNSEECIDTIGLILIDSLSFLTKRDYNDTNANTNIISKNFSALAEYVIFEGDIITQNVLEKSLDSSVLYGWEYSLCLGRLLSLAQQRKIFLYGADKSLNYVKNIAVKMVKKLGLFLSESTNQIMSKENQEAIEDVTHILGQVTIDKNDDAPEFGNETDHAKWTEGQIHTAITLMKFLDRNQLSTILMTEIGRILSLDPTGDTSSEAVVSSSVDKKTCSLQHKELKRLIGPCFFLVNACLMRLSNLAQNQGTKLHKQGDLLLEDEKIALKALLQLIWNWRQNFEEDFLFSCDIFTRTQTQMDNCKENMLYLNESYNSIVFVVSIIEFLELAVRHLTFAGVHQEVKPFHHEEELPTPYSILEASHWDLILCALSSWTQSMEESSFSMLFDKNANISSTVTKQSKGVIKCRSSKHINIYCSYCHRDRQLARNFGVAVSNLTVTVSKWICYLTQKKEIHNDNSASKQKEQSSDVIEEWQNFFADGIYSVILNTFVCMASTFQDNMKSKAGKRFEDKSVEHNDEGRNMDIINTSTSMLNVQLLSALGSTLRTVPDEQLIESHGLPAKFNTQDVMTCTPEQLALPDKIVFLLNHLCPLLSSTERAIQTTAFYLLSRTMKKIAEHENSRNAKDNDANKTAHSLDDEDSSDEYREIPKRLAEIMQKLEIVISTLFKEFELSFGEQLPAPFPVESAAYNSTLTYLLTWRLILALVENVSGDDLRPKYSEFLRRGGHLEIAMMLIFHMIVSPVETNHPDSDLSLDESGLSDENYSVQSYHEKPNKSPMRKASKSYPKDNSEYLLNERTQKNHCMPLLECNIGDTTLEMQDLARNIYYGMLKYLPALVRNWWNLSDKRTANIVEKFTISKVAPTLWSEEVERINSVSVDTFDNMTIKVRSSVREVVAIYTLGDDGSEGSMELVIQLPSNFPLGAVQVESGKRVGVTTAQWRTWMLQLTTFLQHQNGSIVDGLTVWKKNVDKRFQGVEECYICFYVLHGTNHQLPKLACRTCKKKFHAACLYKWFSTSNNSTCPLCRNLF